MTGTHTIAQSFECRNVLTASRKNKGKSPRMGKYMEMISEVTNNIIPILKKQLDFGGKILSGKTYAEVLMATKSLYSDSRFAVQGVAKKMAKEMPPARSDFAWTCFVMFGPQGNQYAEFCFPTYDDAQVAARPHQYMRSMTGSFPLRLGIGFFLAYRLYRLLAGA